MGSSKYMRVCRYILYLIDTIRRGEM